MGIERKKTNWREMSPANRARIMLTAALQLTLLIVALLDIKKRPADEVRGSKGMWRALVFINFVGPIAYFTLGRKRDPELAA